MAKMSDKTKRAINRGRRKAGLKPIKFGSKKTKNAKSNPHTMPDDPTFATKSKVIFGWDVIGKTDNFAWVQKSGKKYQVITFRKHSTPQEFAHKNMSKKEAINYAQSFNFLNK